MDAQPAVVDLNGKILLQNLGSAPIRLATIKLFRYFLVDTETSLKFGESKINKRVVSIKRCILEN